MLLDTLAHIFIWFIGFKFYFTILGISSREYIISNIWKIFIGLNACHLPINVGILLGVNIIKSIMNKRYFDIGIQYYFLGYWLISAQEPKTLNPILTTVILGLFCGEIVLNSVMISQQLMLKIIVKLYTSYLLQEKLLVINHDDYPNDTCGICREDFSETVYVGNCGHGFCFRCIQQWVLSQTFEGEHPHILSLNWVNCPTCRKPLSYGSLCDKALEIVKTLAPMIM